MLTDEELARVESWARHERRGDVLALCGELRRLRGRADTVTLPFEAAHAVAMHDDGFVAPPATLDDCPPAHVVEGQ